MKLSRIQFINIFNIYINIHDRLYMCEEMLRKNITFIYGSLIATDIIQFIIRKSYAFLFLFRQISLEVLPLCAISLFLFISLQKRVILVYSRLSLMNSL